MKKGVSFAMQVLIVIVVIMIVALVVLSIFGGGIQNISQSLEGLSGTSTTCADVGGSCVVGTACSGTGQTINIAGNCPAGQICCMTASS